MFKIIIIIMFKISGHAVKGAEYRFYHRKPLQFLIPIQFLVIRECGMELLLL